MAADTHEELVTMADRIGVARKWIQDADTYSEHFDICLSKRRLAVAFGAKELTMRELVTGVMHRKRLAREPRQDAKG